jgi:hypothetical protein
MGNSNATATTTTKTFIVEDMFTDGTYRVIYALCSGGVNQIYLSGGGLTTPEGRIPCIDNLIIAIKIAHKCGAIAPSDFAIHLIPDTFSSQGRDKADTANIQALAEYFEIDTTDRSLPPGWRPVGTGETHQGYSNILTPIPAKEGRVCDDLWIQSVTASADSEQAIEKFFEFQTLYAPPGWNFAPKIGSVVPETVEPILGLVQTDDQYYTGSEKYLRIKQWLDSDKTVVLPQSYCYGTDGATGKLTLNIFKELVAHAFSDEDVKKFKCIEDALLETPRSFIVRGLEKVDPYKEPIPFLNRLTSEGMDCVPGQKILHESQKFYDKDPIKNAYFKVDFVSGNHGNFVASLIKWVTGVPAIEFTDLVHAIAIKLSKLPIHSPTSEFIAFDSKTGDMHPVPDATVGQEVFWFNFKNEKITGTVTAATIPYFGTTWSADALNSVAVASWLIAVGGDPIKLATYIDNKFPIAGPAFKELHSIDEDTAMEE